MISEVHHIDCVAYMQTLPDKFFDLAIVDIEYGIGASKPSVKPCTVKQKNGSILSVNKPNYSPKDWDFKKSGKEYFTELIRVSKNQIIWGGNYYGLQGGYLVWNKLNGSTDQFGCELAWLSFSKRTDIVNFLWSGMIQGVYCGVDVRKALVQQGNKSFNEARIHPTQKPVALYSWLLQNYAKQGDKIFDSHMGSHMGSQSSRIAAYKLGFDYWGCELDKDYFEQGNARFAKAIDEPLFKAVEVNQASIFQNEFTPIKPALNQNLK